LKLIGSVALSVGLIASALPARAADSPPDQAEALNASGAEKLSRGDPAGASLDFTAAITARSSFVYAYINRGIARSRLGQYDSAIADYDSAIALQPSYAAYFNRANALLNKGDVDGAIADYTKSLDFTTDFRRSELAAGIAGALEQRGTAKQIKGDFEGAADDYSRAVQEFAGKGDESARILRAVVLRRLSRGDPMSGLEKSLAGSRDEWAKTVAAYLSGSLPEDAFLAKAEAADGANSLAQRCAAQYYVGMSRLSRGDAAGARAAFRAAVDANAKNVDAFNLARAEWMRL
jgi:tetratricopeptide (TPR) repeat protein